jgi:PAS domain S-box-containing protein
MNSPLLISPGTDCRDSTMNLRTKLLLGIGLALIIVFTLVAVFSCISMEESYRALERQEVRRAADSTVNTLTNDIENLDSVTRDYAAWNDTYRFTEGQNPGWIEQNTASDFFERFGISYVLAFNRSGAIVFTKGYNSSSEQQEEVPAALADDIIAMNTVTGFPSFPEGLSGITGSPAGLLIVSSHPVLHDDLSGPAGGNLFLVRRVDSRYLSGLATRAGYNVTLLTAEEVTQDRSLAAMVSGITAASPAAVIPESEDTVAGYKRIGSLQDQQGYFVRITEPRTLYHAGRDTIGIFLVSLLGAGIVIIVFILLFIDRVVLSRLNTIIRNVRKNQETGDDPGVAGYDGDDELARLALEIDPVFNHLTESRLQLRESEERYRTLAESAQDFIFIIDKEDRITYVNSFAARSVGRSRDDLIGRTRAELFPQAESQRQRTNIIRVLVSGEPLSIESSLPLPSGTRWHDTLLVPVKDRTGTVTGVMGISRDITGRKLAEEALRQSEMRYHELFELGGEAVFLIDNESGRFLEANAAASEMYGYSHAELLDMRNSGLSAEPEDTLKITTGSPEGSIVVPIRYHRRKDGTVFPVEINGRFFMSGSKSVHVAAIRDITQRVRAESTLRESNERFKTVMDSLDAFVYVADMKNHEILFLNRTGRNIWGNIVGSRCWETIQKGQTGPCGFCTNDKLLDADGNPTEVVVWEIRNTVNGRWYECRDRAIRWTDGRLVRLEISTDITDRKRVEDALVRVNNKLNLLSGITRHDILNQLTALKAYIDLSAEHTRDNVVSEFIRKEMMIANVIDRQISFTRDYHKLGVMSPVWQNVADIIEWAKQSLLIRNVDIRTDFRDLEVFADPLLEKVFYNLMDNALRYGGEKMTAIRFRIQETDDALIICCEDDGIGIAEENKDLIFNRGYAHNTGLGLFLSREILGITECSITETGIFGTGARFEIRVPKGSYRFNGIGTGS